MAKTALAKLHLSGLTTHRAGQPVPLPIGNRTQLMSVKGDRKSIDRVSLVSGGEHVLGLAADWCAMDAAKLRP
jgi:hypothetical protein